MLCINNVHLQLTSLKKALSLVPIPMPKVPIPMSKVSSPNSQVHVLCPKSLVPCLKSRVPRWVAWWLIQHFSNYQNILFYYHKEYILSLGTVFKDIWPWLRKKFISCFDNFKYLTAILALCFNFQPIPSCHHSSMSSFWLRPPSPSKAAAVSAFWLRRPQKTCWYNTWTLPNLFSSAILLIYWSVGLSYVNLTLNFNLLFCNSVILLILDQVKQEIFKYQRNFFPSLIEYHWVFMNFAANKNLKCHLLTSSVPVG